MAVSRGVNIYLLKKMYESSQKDTCIITLKTSNTVIIWCSLKSRALLNIMCVLGVLLVLQALTFQKSQGVRYYN